MINIDFFKTFIYKTNFPPDAVSHLLNLTEGLLKGNNINELSSITDIFYRSDFDITAINNKVADFAQKNVLPIYTAWLLLFIFAAEHAKEAYLSKNATEDIYWDTFNDLRYKALECKSVHNVYGTFVPNWYPRFYKANIFKLGCMQYDIDKYVDVENEPYTYGNYTVTNKDFVLGIHIPSSGEPFDRTARLDSYKKAYKFFTPQLSNNIMICGCHSWLLYSCYKDVFPQNSNIRSFADEFDIHKETESENFGDAWRIFGAEFDKNPNDFPETTSLQRAFKKHILSNGKFGIGQGVLLFDGEKIITAKEQNNHEDKA